MEKIIIIFTIVLMVAMIAFGLALLLSPKLRAKLMSKGVKAQKYMLEESKDDIKEVATGMAEATEEAVEITARAIKKGVTKEASAYCKHCGQKIDADSKFCGKCGKQL
ncbi:MAG: zinc ribbon domain-containing protein [Clostridia bacterium]|nr:zinc ribbon domain-containing protein [Clostridia bacterium]